jgi:hypothetical protein
MGRRTRSSALAAASAAAAAPPPQSAAAAAGGPTARRPGGGPAARLRPTEGGRAGVMADSADGDRNRRSTMLESKKKSRFNSNTMTDSADGDRNAELSNANKSFADRRVTGDIV